MSKNDVMRRLFRALVCVSRVGLQSSEVDLGRFASKAEAATEAARRDNVLVAWCALTGDIVWKRPGVLFRSTVGSDRKVV